MVYNPACTETGKALSSFSPRDVGIRTGLLTGVFAGRHIRNILKQCTMQEIREVPDTRPAALSSPGHPLSRLRTAVQLLAGMYLQQGSVLGPRDYIQPRGCDHELTDRPPFGLSPTILPSIEPYKPAILGSFTNHIAYPHLLDRADPLYSTYLQYVQLLALDAATYHLPCGLSDNHSARNVS